MDLTRGLSWLTSLGSRKAGPTVGHEPADMGTAFGLDASLAEAFDAELPEAGSVSTEAPTVDRLNRRSVI